jgi:uncharacterized protein YjiS (DUF1127 family)
MNILRSLELAWLRHSEYRKARTELDSYSERQLNSDLRLNRSDIPDIAAEAADARVAEFVRANPEYRQAWSPERYHHFWA